MNFSAVYQHIKTIILDENKYDSTDISPKQRHFLRIGVQINGLILVLKFVQQFDCYIKR
jgi:hypothetical protein